VTLNSKEPPAGDWNLLKELKVIDGSLLHRGKIIAKSVDFKVQDYIKLAIL
jgi:hypothetical protein